jgi:hypothetical protein
MTNTHYAKEDNKDYKPKDTPVASNTQPKDEKKELTKKIENTKRIFSSVAEDNKKIKAPTKDYLEADLNNNKPKVEVEIEKPKFVNKHVDDPEHPHFVNIDKNEDVYNT